MATYETPSNDESRLTFMKLTIQAADQDIEAGNFYISQERLDEVIAFLPGFETKANNVMDKMGDRTKVVRRQNELLDQFELTLRHLWRSIIHRVKRYKEPVEVLTYYGLPQDGVIPNPTTRKGWITLAKKVMAGDEKAVARGYKAVENPAVDELATLLEDIKSAMRNVAQADRVYDVAQEVAAEIRPLADALIGEVMSKLRYTLRHKDRSSRRRIMRSYGAQYSYQTNEKEEEGIDGLVDDVSDNGKGSNGKKKENAADFDPTSEAAFNR